MVVLFVDPSSDVRTKRTQALASTGLTVYEADGAEAAVAVAQHLRELDVLVSEGVLDGEFTGFDLRDAIRQKFPSLRVVFTSRYELSGMEGMVASETILYEPLDEGLLIKRVTDGHVAEQAAVAVEPAPAPQAAAAAVAAETEPPIPAPPEVIGPDASVSAAAEENVPAVQETSPEVVQEANVPETAAAADTAAPPPAESAPAPAAVSEPVELPAEQGDSPIFKTGTLLGNYVIKEMLYAERDTQTYLALQTAVQREVALVLLRPEYLSDPEAVEKFRERSRLKASVSHPRIAPLYEAIETEGWAFYTREMPHGRSLDDLILSGAKYEEKELVDIVAGVSEAMSQAMLRGYNYRMPTPRDIFLDEVHEASVVNVFRPATAKERDHASDTGRFLMMLRPLCHGPRARHLVDELSREHLDWEALRQRAVELQAEHRQRSLLRRADTKEAHEIQAAAQAARQGFPLWGLLFFVLIIVGLAALGWRAWQDRPRPSAPPVPEEMVKVPGGEFIYQEAEKRTLPDYWIDKYEVTIGQYAEFLDALQKDPKKGREYDHPDQPAAFKPHKPDKWEETYNAARNGGLINNQRVDLNCPVADVSWWDAFAYARWKGRHLPSEEEWEKAARGTDGRRFPWGDKDEPGWANLGDDYDPVGKKGGKVDGYNYWEPVNRIKHDVSPCGAVGMAGNVEEWTGSWVNHPDVPDYLVPVVRGGDFAVKSSDNLLTGRFPSKSPDHRSLLRGFRTASDKPPPEAAPKP
jgi:formylglycine-generating enzyme required for sulfatase activity/CheY-like chemotaxis protein